jgi:hypothetical protein
VKTSRKKRSESSWKREEETIEWKVGRRTAKACLFANGSQEKALGRTDFSPWQVKKRELPLLWVSLSATVVERNKRSGPQEEVNPWSSWSELERIPAHVSLAVILHDGEFSPSPSRTQLMFVLVLCSAFTGPGCGAVQPQFGLHHPRPAQGDGRLCAKTKGTRPPWLITYLKHSETRK